MCEQSDHQPAVLRELVERVQRIDVIGTPEWDREQLRPGTGAGLTMRR
jgi:hypothetical protein